MKENYTDITVVLDRSGSMESTRDDAIGGFNEVIAKQQEVIGEVRLTLVQFDDEYEKVYENRHIRSAPKLTHETFVPRGSTALLDAIGRTVADRGEFFQGLKEKERPTRVILVIITDGGENCSREYNASTVKAMLETQQNKYNWEVVFIGSNQDAVVTARTYGINLRNAMSYASNSEGTRAAFMSVASNLQSFATGATLNMAFSDEDKLAQVKAGLTTPKS